MASKSIQHDMVKTNKPKQNEHHAASDQSLHSLPAIQQLLDTGGCCMEVGFLSLR